jgi:hypothetical protein
LAVLARKFVRTRVVPKSINLGSVPEHNVRRALEFLFGGGNRKDGKFVVQLPERLRSAEVLQALADRLGIVAEPQSDKTDKTALTTALLRQGLIHPEYAPLLETLRSTDDLTRLFRNQANAEDRLAGLLRAVQTLESNQTTITLSQLGATALNDSKALRSGPLRKLLVTMLSTLAEIEDEDPAKVLARFGVIDNPYTTLALLYGPVVYKNVNGHEWNWPEQLHAAGQAAALTWEQVQGMRVLRPTSPVAGIITSENAAPFHRLVETRSPSICVYTEGYPNAAVTRVLALLAQSGLRARHWGDTDLDGLRIAECVSRVIPTELHCQDHGTLDTLKDRLIPLTDPQRTRATAYLASHPDFPFRSTLTYSLQHGWLEQEQTTTHATPPAAHLPAAPR